MLSTLDTRPILPTPILAGAEAAKGNDAEAKLALAEARRLFPQLTIKWLLTETANHHRSLSMACARLGCRKNERSTLSSDQLIEQRLRLFQIERIEPFGEPAVDRSKKIAGLIPLTLIAPEPRHAHRGTQLPGFCLLLTRDR